MSLKLSAQVNPNFSCDDFSFDVSSNTRASVEFLSKKKYLDAIKDSIPRSQKPIIQENEILNTEFQKNFPNIITEHCVHSKSFEDGQIGEISFCSKKYKMFLVSKEYHFYIFKIQAFEIDGYLVFNSDDKTIYNTDHYPIILDNGKMILDIGYRYGGTNIIKYYKFNDKKVDYFELSFPFYNQIKSYNIIKKFDKFKLAVELIKYNTKETAPNKYEDDKNDFCSKLLIIN
jgi:hypothetical protein